MTDAPFGVAHEDFYQTNPIARASSIMAELSALTREHAQDQEATGTDG
jgi:NADH-quinone oxidoreductase subunit G